MIKITSREFQRNFRRYIGAYESVEVVRRGEAIGIWVPAGVRHEEEDGVGEEESKGGFLVGGISIPGVSRGAEFFNSGGSDNVESINGETGEIIEEGEKRSCKKCGVAGNLGGWHKYFDEIECEEVENWFCFKCARERGIKLKV